VGKDRQLLIVVYNGCNVYKPSCLHCNGGVWVHKMIAAVVGRIFLLLPRHRLTLDICVLASLTLDKFTIFHTSAGILDPLLNAHCRCNVSLRKIMEGKNLLVTGDGRWFDLHGIAAGELCIIGHQ
jgi:hypothetical protein